MLITTLRQLITLHVLTPRQRAKAVLLPAAVHQVAHGVVAVYHGRINLVIPQVLKYCLTPAFVPAW